MESTGCPETPVKNYRSTTRFEADPWIWERKVVPKRP